MRRAPRHAHGPRRPAPSSAPLNTRSVSRLRTSSTSGAAYGPRNRPPHLTSRRAATTSRPQPSRSRRRWETSGIRWWSSGSNGNSWTGRSTPARRFSSWSSFGSHRASRPRSTSISSASNSPRPAARCPASSRGSGCSNISSPSCSARRRGRIWCRARWRCPSCPRYRRPVFRRTCSRVGRMFGPHRRALPPPITASPPRSPTDCRPSV